jgi:quercetin dioxygenase-like cupin family protein
MGNDDEERLRVKPSDRFEGDLHKFDLDAELKRIRSEDLSEEHLRQGHRQIELQRDNGTTLSLYHFEPDGTIPEHSLDDGLVIIHVLDGKVTVKTDDGDVSLEGDDLVTLKPDLAHSLEAQQESHLLLTISR